MRMPVVVWGMASSAKPTTSLLVQQSARSFELTHWKAVAQPVSTRTH